MAHGCMEERQLQSRTDTGFAWAILGSDVQEVIWAVYQSTSWFLQMSANTPLTKG
jgi:hypothetical protein